MPWIDTVVCVPRRSQPKYSTEQRPRTQIPRSRRVGRCLPGARAGDLGTTVYARSWTEFGVSFSQYRFFKLFSENPTKSCSHSACFRFHKPFDFQKYSDPGAELAQERVPRRVRHWVWPPGRRATIALSTPPPVVVYLLVCLFFSVSMLVCSFLLLSPLQTHPGAVSPT